MSFASMSVNELREELVKYGFSKEEADNIKGKSNLVYELQKAGYKSETSETSDAIETFTIDEQPTEKLELVNNISEKEEKNINPQHPEWTNYVMQHFAEDELFMFGNNKYPSVAGLRRVAELLLGDILYSKPVECIITHPKENLPFGSASVRYEICFLWKLGMPDYIQINEDFPQKVFGGMGGANDKNTDDNFCIYPEQIAETRAEGRALRKALGLKNIIAIEEITKKDINDIMSQSKTSEWEPSDKINSNQKAAIETLCARYEIDVNKFINSGVNSYNSINDITKDVAAKMIQELSRYQNSEVEKPIPDKVKK